MDNENFQGELLKRLDAILKLLVVSNMKDVNQTEKIILLDNIGFAPKDIADLLNTTSNYVSVILSNSRKKNKRKDKIAVSENIDNPEQGETQNG